MWTFTKSLLSSFKRPVFVYLISISMTAQLVAAALFYFAEHGHNPQILGFFEFLYFTVTVMTGVGLGDLYPITVLGRTLAMLMMLFGTAIFVCFTAVLAVSILEVELEHRTKE